jgi:hypothetical protein
MNVNHREILDLFGLLRRVAPDAVVVDRQEMARIDGLVFTLELAQTIVHDEYNGFVLTAINPAVGKLDATVLNFREHRVIVRSGPKAGDLKAINQYDWDRLVAGGSKLLMFQELENAVANYVAVYTG